MPTTRSGNVTDQVLMALRRIIRAIDLHSRDLVGNYGLTGPQLMVLRVLASGNGRLVGEVARQVHLSQATVTGIVGRLEKRGLVTRVRGDEDKRQVVVSLTAVAREMLAQAPPLLQESFIKEFSKLQDWEQSQILSALQRIVAMMEAKDIDATPMLATGPIHATPEWTGAFLGQKQQKANEVPAVDDLIEPSPEPAEP